jgi:hypothetical protein
MPNPYAAVGLTYDGEDVQLADGSLFLEIREGLGSYPSLRGDDVLRPGLPGRRARNRIGDVLGLELTGWMKEASLSDFAVARRYLAGLFRPTKGLRPLEATLEDGRVISIPARAMPDGISYGDEPAATRTVNIALEAPDPPYWRGAEVIDLDRAFPASPTNFTLTNEGNERTHEIIFEIDGPVTNPRITNLDLDVYVEALVSVGAGEVLTIDGAAFTADIDGTSAIGSIRHSGHRLWMLLDPGDNSMRLTATTPGGTVTSRFRPVYL